MLGKKNQHTAWGYIVKQRISGVFRVWHTHCMVWVKPNGQDTFTTFGRTQMYNSEFFASKLGQAAMASVAAMVMLIAVSTQFEAAHGPVSPIALDHVAVEIA